MEAEYAQSTDLDCGRQINKPLMRLGSKYALFRGIVALGAVCRLYAVFTEKCRPPNKAMRTRSSRAVCSTVLQEFARMSACACKHLFQKKPLLR